MRISRCGSADYNSAFNTLFKSNVCVSSCRKFEYTKETLLKFKEELAERKANEGKATGGFGGFGGGGAPPPAQTQEKVMPFSYKNPISQKVFGD